MATATRITSFNWDTRASFVLLSWLDSYGRRVEKAVHYKAISWELNETTEETPDKAKPDILTLKLFGEPVLVFSNNNVSAMTSEGAPTVQGLASALAALMGNI